MVDIFRYAVRTAQALGYDEPDGTTKTKDDIISDLDFQDQQLEDFLSGVAQTNTSTGVWVDYSPTIAGTGWSIGNGTVSGERIYNGDRVDFYAILTFGTTTAAGGGSLQISLPATPDVTPLPLTVRVLDSSAGKRYGGVGETSSTYAFPMVFQATGELGFVVSGVPVGFSTGDTVMVTGTYPRSA